jgi:hypothetical protein
MWAVEETKRSLFPREPLTDKEDPVAIEGCAGLSPAECTGENTG